MADTNKSIVYNVEINDKGKVKIAGLTNGFVKLDNGLKKVNADLREQQALLGKTNKSLDGNIDKTGLAGATVVEMGRAISDSNYGIRGMANNLSQLSTLMITLITTTGGVVNGLKALWSALAGPLGVIIVFQTIITLFEKYDMDAKKAEKSATSFAGAIADSVDSLNDYLSVIEDIVLTQDQLNVVLGGAAASDKKLNKFLKESNLSQEQKNELIKEYLSTSQLLNVVNTKISEEETKRRELDNFLTNQELEALEKKIELHETDEQLQLTGLANEVTIKMLKNKLELAKEDISNAAESVLIESELLLLRERLLEQQGDLTSGDKSSREQIKSLKPFFDKFFFDINDKGKQVFKGMLDDVQFTGRVLEENAISSTEELSEMGRRYDEHIKRLDESAKAGIAFIKNQAKEIQGVFSATQKSLGYLGGVFNSYNEARMEALARERDYILNSGKLNSVEQQKAIKELEKRERKAQERKIKSERDMFTIKQSLLIAEEIMRAKAFAAEQIRTAQLAVSKGKASAQQIALDAATSIGAANMSIGAFVKALGPYGTAAFAISIGGIIASIVAARKKANSAISALGAPSTGGGGGVGVEAPDFNVVGASPESQLAQTVAGTQEKPLKAFVVLKDINNAEEFDRNNRFKGI
jgi:hypothetical protein